jgi:hypothetical protein
VAAFERDVVLPFVVETDAKSALKNGIWITLAFGSGSMLQSMHAHFEEKLPQRIAGGGELVRATTNKAVCAGGPGRSGYIWR